MPKGTPRRITVTLASTVADKLQRWADARGQAIATVAGVAIELAVNAAEDRGEIPRQELLQQELPQPEVDLGRSPHAGRYPNPTGHSTGHSTE
ncbi:MAG: hypothetical protein ACFB8W_23530 [Elainellaceae cyanobacterium]